MDTIRRSLLMSAVLAAGGVLAYVGTADAASSAREINADADRALNQLYGAHPKARDLAKRAKAVLIFPKIYKGGLVIGGLSGDGVLRANNKATGYYNISAASFGLQASRIPSFSLVAHSRDSPTLRKTVPSSSTGRDPWRRRTAPALG